MQQRQPCREFKLEAVKLVRELGNRSCRRPGILLSPVEFEEQAMLA